MDVVTRHILILRLLVPPIPVLSYPFEVLFSMMGWDGMQNDLWGGSTAVQLNSTFLCSSDFFLIRLALLTWEVDFSAIYLSF